MSLFRSAGMKYFEMHVPKEDGYEVINRLADNDFVQFLDAASQNFHKPFFHKVKKCEEALLKIDHILLKNIREQRMPEEIPIVENVLDTHKEILRRTKISSYNYIDRLQSQVTQEYEQLEKLEKSYAEFQNKIVELQDYKYLLFKARQIFNSANNQIKNEQLIDKSPSLDNISLLNISGIVHSSELQQFIRMIFRGTKGNSIVYTFNIPNDCPELQNRSAFIIIIEAGANLVTKVNRICESFNAKQYKLPTNKEEVFDKIKEIEDTINDTKQLVALADKSIRELLESTLDVKTYEYAKYQCYRILFSKEVIIFQTLNLLDQTTNTYLAKIWVPEAKVGLLYSLIPSFVNLKEIEVKAKPPTHYEINNFTAPFQQIINTYGVPRYQEINPALFAIPIFPFLFGVMFGDIGHGGVLLGFAIWLTYSKTAQRLLPDIYKIRFMILMMGLFSFYSGWIYNQFFSIPLNVFGSCYGEAHHGQFAQKQHNCVYPFGFDPKWIRSSNELNYFNSYKMKFAVVIGVLQMTLGIFLKMLNSLHFKLFLDLFFEWLPQQIFFACTFGYMSFLILYKWTIAWGIERDTSTAPSLIGQMIALPLKMGSTEGKPLWDIQSQQSLQYYLLIAALICVPTMLIFKPLIIWLNTPSHPQDQHRYSYRTSDDDFNEEINQQQNQMAKKDLHQEHDMSQIVVHQIIETIEFVLGTISNTASYLRLWALSLAHGQLSRVFFEKTVGGGVVSANVLMILIGMFFFYYITLGIIMGMDSMECFLHALRLQWVEFDSKFFKADGWKFSPLALSAPLQQAADNLRVVE